MGWGKGGGAGREQLAGPLASSAVSTKWASFSHRSFESRTETTSPSCWLATRQIWKHSARSGIPLPPTPTPSQSGRLLLAHLLRLLTSTSTSDSLGLQPRTPLVIASESPALPTWEFSGEVVEWEKGCLPQGPPAPALFRPIPSSCSHLEPGFTLLWISPLQSTSRSSCPSAHTPARPPGP